MERAPKFSASGGSLPAEAEREPRGSVPPWEAADGDAGLAVGPVRRCPGVVARRLHDRGRDKSCSQVRFRVLGEFFTVENRENLAAATDTFLPFRTHERATDDNILATLSSSAQLN